MTHELRTRIAEAKAVTETTWQTVLDTPAGTPAAEKAHRAHRAAWAVVRNLRAEAAR